MGKTWQVLERHEVNEKELAKSQDGEERRQKHKKNDQEHRSADRGVPNILHHSSKTKKE